MSYFKQESFFWLKGFYIVVIAVFLGACGNLPDHSKYIPKDVSFVVCLNLKEMTEGGADWQEIFMKMIPVNRKIKLENSGINFTNKAYIFSDYNSENVKEAYYAITFSLEDEGKFDQFLRSYLVKRMNIGSFAGMHYTVLENNSILGWVNKVAILVMKNENVSEEVLKDRLVKLRDLPEEQALKENNSQFKKLRISDKYDIATWTNLKSYDNLVKKSLRKIPVPINIDLTNNYLTTEIDFKAGQVLVNSKFYNLNKSFEDYRDMVKYGVSKELILSLSTDAPVGLLGLGLNMEGIKDAFHNVGGDLLTNQTFSLTGVKPDNIIDMLSGDLLGVLKDIKKINEEGEVHYEYALGVGIQNKEVLEQILNKFLKDKVVIKRKDGYYWKNMEVFLLEKNDILYITPSEQVMNKISQKDIVQTTIEIDEITNQSCFFLRADVRDQNRKKIPGFLFKGNKKWEGYIKYAAIPIETVSINTLPLQDNISDTEIVFSLKEKDKNALKVLMRVIKKQNKFFLKPSK